MTNLSTSLIAGVCSAIMDSGFQGSAEEYVKLNLGKEFNDLTVCEAETLIMQLIKVKTDPS